MQENFSSLVSLAGDHLGTLDMAANLLEGLSSTHDILAGAARVAFVGVCTALMRLLFLELKRILLEAIFPTAFVEEGDPAFNWIMVYLAQDPSAQSQIKSFRLSASDAREGQRATLARGSRLARLQQSQMRDESRATFATDDVVAQMLPVYERDIKIKFNGATLWVQRSEKHFALTTDNRACDHLRITGLCFQPDSIKQFLVAAHRMFFRKSDSEILVFHTSTAHVASMISAWLEPISRPTRPWSSVILPAETKDMILEDVRDFMSAETKQWYATKGIPHRRGYLLHGRPGAGKTTLATAIASELKLDVYIVNPSAKGMDDEKLNKAFRTCPAGNMLLIEDIDCILPSRTDGEGKGHGAPGAGGRDKGFDSNVTLSGLLNAIDGVSSQEDCVLFASTNHPERLDEALKRPGRFDVHVEFFDATHAQAVALFKHFYPVSDSPKEDEVDEKAEAALDDLAHDFANKVFSADKLPDESDLPIAMAAIQGYLLQHKNRPRRAVEQVQAWIQEIWEAKKKEVERKMKEAEEAAKEEAKKEIEAKDAEAKAAEAARKAEEEVKKEAEKEEAKKPEEEQASAGPDQTAATPAANTDTQPTTEIKKDAVSRPTLELPLTPVSP